jgi:spore coat polysaccharide biosynthesis protein SpsF
MTTVVIVQARMGSTRLPGKVMMPLGSRSVLEHVLTRCQRISTADKVCLATSVSPRDDVVAEEARRLGVELFRGDELDVLSRYYGAAKMLGADEILRVTADCPLIDPGVCDAVIRIRRRAGTDYACNFSPPTFPHGLDCEAFSMTALARAQRSSDTAYQREHVTVWLIENPTTTKANLTHDGPNASRHRWTLDTPEDYRFLSGVFLNHPITVATLHWRELLDELDNTPAARQI